MDALTGSGPGFGLHLSTRALQLRAQPLLLPLDRRSGQGPSSEHGPARVADPGPNPAAGPDAVLRHLACRRTGGDAGSFGTGFRPDAPGDHRLLDDPFGPSPGSGTEMRTAVLLYAFDLPGAEVAESDAASWNLSSLGVPRTVGYQDNGVTRRIWGRTAQDVQKVQLTPELLQRPVWGLEVAGHDAVASFLALPETAQAVPGREPVAVRSTME